MDERTLQKLEYERILELLAAENSNKPGQELALSLEPSSNLSSCSPDRTRLRKPCAFSGRRGIFPWEESGTSERASSGQGLGSALSRWNF